MAKGLAGLAEAHRQSARRFGCGDVQPRALVHQRRDALPLGRLGRAEALHAEAVAQRLGCADGTGRDGMGRDGTGQDGVCVRVRGGARVYAMNLTLT